MRREDYDNPMAQNVRDVPNLCISQCRLIEEASRLTITTPEIWDLGRIILTGCGDSYAAGLAMKPAIETLTGLPTEVITAVDLARYTPSELLTRQYKTTLVLAVSNSGKVARLGEAIERAGKYGCLTVAVTGNKEARLAKAAKKVVEVSIPPFAAGNGVRSYLVSMLALLLIAIRIGEVKGRYMMDDSQRLREEICRYAGEAEKILPQLEDQMFRIAEEHTSKELFDFIGSGGNTGTAWFSQAKIIEATGEWAAYTDTEGWMHLNCFFKHLSRKLTVLYASAKGPELSRSMEIIAAIAEMEVDFYVITDSSELLLPKGAKRILVPGCREDFMWPLLNYLPISLLAGYLCELKGESYGRGARDNWKVCGTTQLLTDSKIEII